MKNLLVLCLFLSGLCACSASKKASVSTDTAPTVPSNEPVMVTVEQMPKFQGSQDYRRFGRWIADRLTYPQEIKNAYIEGYGRLYEGRVLATFILERDGSIQSVEIKSSPNNLLSSEVRRLIRNSPKWTPGYQRGEAKRVRFTLPVDFNLSEAEKERLAKQREAKAASL